MTARGRATHLPGVAVLAGYRREWLRGDLLAGVAVAAYLVPQVMAYSGIAGLPPQTGLWACLGSLAIYAVFGSSRQLSVGPESTTALMTATAVAPLALGDPVRHAALAAGLALVVGVICLVGGLLRAGSLADLLSQPVLVGYMAGIAVIMIIGQLGAVTGVPMEGDSPPAEVASFLSGLAGAHLPTVALALSLLVGMLVGTKLRPTWPVPMIGMLAATAVVAAFSLDAMGVRLVGSSVSGLPVPGLPALSAHDVVSLLLPAVGVAIVGYSDNVLTARAFAARHGQTVQGTTELVALGAANLAAGVLRGFPVSSSGSRTAIGDAQGSRTQLHSLVALVLVVVVLVAGGALLSRFPRAALGAVVIYAALRLVDIAGFRRIARFRRSEAAITVVTMVAVLTVGVLYGVLVAVGLSVLDLLRRVARPHDGVLGYVPGIAGMHDMDDYPDARPVPGLLVYRYDAPLCFANAENFRSRALAALETQPEPPQWFLLNAEANVEIDSTAAQTLEALHDELRRRGIVLALARVKQDLRADLWAAGLLDLIGEERIFPTLPTAVEAFRSGSSPPEEPSPPKA
ncbi:SulP family inorganic anion transporter [Pseudonocardia charpentierae]|uniref:Sulfate permease n=1 Tax=Pseudonocardia charpentierae TaxID=3075545 RepID=A0ABU2NHV6_9PSEU|nr:sulfate permease [Pseudonocardia sp. DSM 45834]MDT0352598.1 sulfate permease [Pseudonocardia sp. DSM 45834]